MYFAIEFYVFWLATIDPINFKFCINDVYRIGSKFNDEISEKNTKNHCRVIS